MVSLTSSGRIAIFIFNWRKVIKALLIIKVFSRHCNVLRKGYIEFRSPIRFGTLKRRLPRASWRKCRGTQAQNIHYCSKPVPECTCDHCGGSERLPSSGPWSFGEPAPDAAVVGRKAKRIDLLQLRDAILKDGKTEREIIMDDVLCGPALRYPKALQRLLLSRPLEEREDAPEVILLYGPGGCGKTSSVRRESKDLYAPPVGSSKWFDGYMDQEDVLFDEFEGRMSKWELSTFNQVIDRLSSRIRC